MSFMRKKGDIWQLVENRRVDGKVRQRVIASLGRGGDLAITIASLTSLLAHKKKFQGKNLPGQGWRSRAAAEKKLGMMHDYAYWCKGREISHEDYESKIKTYISARYDSEVARRTKQIASLESRLEQIWRHIPEGERGEMETAVSERTKEEQQRTNAAIADLLAIMKRKPVVPEVSNDLDTTGTTVVPEMSSQLRNPGTTCSSAFMPLGGELEELKRRAFEKAAQFAAEAQ